MQRRLAPHVPEATVAVPRAMVRTLIVDDHCVIRRGLRHILGGDDDQFLVGEATNAHEALKQLREHTWDVVLLDISLPDKDGIETLHQLRKEFPKLRVIMLSSHSEEQFAVRALKAGAWGYLRKCCSPEELVVAVRRVHAGERYISATVAELLAVNLENSPDAPLHACLSNREYQILRLFASGKSVTQTATTLRLSVKTISEYRSRMLKKLGLATNADVTRYAIDHKLVGLGHVDGRL